MIIYAVVVTFNGEHWIKRCLNSLQSSKGAVKTIVVDNASTDGTSKLIATDFTEVILLQQDQNLGFGKGNNVGISYALRHKADFVFLLNQDADVLPETIKALVDTALEHPDYGILSPIHLNWKGYALEHYFSRFVSVSERFPADCDFKKTMQTVYELPFVNAAAWLLPQKVLETVGGFDPIFTHYGEDNNYCHRVLYYGFKIGVLTGVYIGHDSKIRTEPKDYLFSETYYLNEIKQWQIKYGDINQAYDSTHFNLEKRHILKLILKNILKFNWRGIKGYWLKYKIFGKVLKQIKQSRITNANTVAPYLEF